MAHSSHHSQRESTRWYEIEPSFESRTSKAPQAHLNRETDMCSPDPSLEARQRLCSALTTTFDRSEPAGQLSPSGLCSEMYEVPQPFHVIGISYIGDTSGESRTIVTLGEHLKCFKPHLIVEGLLRLKKA